VSLANELPVSRAATFSAWLELTKPRIVSLVIFTGLPALLLAARGWPPAPVAWGALVGIALSAASAASFNHYFDRDIDALMRRTRTRPLPSGALPPAAAVGLGVALGVLAMAVLVATTNLLAAGIALASIVYYALVYTVWLKRRTPMNIVIGGGAGASAPLIAWAAVTGSVGLPAILLASIIFLWTPPHFWALSLYRRDDYERAGLPMLPVTHGEGLHAAADRSLHGGAGRKHAGRGATRGPGPALHRERRDPGRALRPRSRTPEAGAERAEGAAAVPLLDRLPVRALPGDERGRARRGGPRPLVTAKAPAPSEHGPGRLPQKRVGARPAYRSGPKW
jgi:protoheme IX farnesyltransferase